MWGWFGFIGTSIVVCITVFNGVKALLAPLNTSSYDNLWAFVTLALFLMVGLTYRLRRGRLLISLALGSVGIFLLIVILRSGTGFAFLVLVWLLLISGAMGNEFLNKFAPSPKKNNFERIILSISLGLGALSFLALILAVFRILYSIVLFWLLIGITLILSRSLARIFRYPFGDLLRRLRNVWQSRELGLESIALAAVSICLLCSLVWAVAPGIQHDVLRYHLGAPVLYLQKHGLVEIAEDRSTYYAHNAEMMYTLAMGLGGQPLPALLHLTFGLLTTGLAFAFGRQIGGTRVGIFSAVLFYSLPIVTWESGMAHVDLIVTFYVLGATYCVTLWWLQREDLWLMVGGILAGLGLGTKMNAMLVIPFLFVFIGLGLLFRTRSVRSVLRGLLHFTVPALILTAPWLLREWIWTGNPIFPFHYGTSAGPKSGRVVFVHHKELRWDQIIRPVLVHWNLIFRTHEPATPPAQIAGLPLLAFPWLYLWYSPNFFRTAAIALIAFLCCLLWFITFPVLRYLLPITPVLAILAALNIEALWRHFSVHRWGRYVKVIGLILALCYLTATRFVSIAWGWIIPERYPYRVALGLETEEEFLTRNLPVYKSFQFLDRQEDNEERVLSIGNDYRVYTKREVHGIMGSFEARHLVRAMPAGRQLAQSLRQRGYGFLLVNQSMVAAEPYFYRVPVIDETFLRRFTRLEFASDNVYVYRILAMDSGATQLPPENLLSNACFEHLDAAGSPADWYAYGTPQVDRTGRDSRSGAVAVRAGLDEGFFQRVSIVPGRLYTLAHWTRAERRGQNARLQINWLDGSLKLVDVSIVPVAATADWQWHKISATAPNGATFAQVYASVHEHSEVWFDDFQFVQGDLFKETTSHLRDE